MFPQQVSVALDVEEERHLLDHAAATACGAEGVAGDEAVGGGSDEGTQPDRPQDESTHEAGRQIDKAEDSSDNPPRVGGDCGQRAGEKK